jgi:hypothetical protein
MKLLPVALALGALIPAAAQGEVKVEKVAYFNQPNCYKLSNGTVEVIVTTDIGPRVIRYGFVGGDNVLAEMPEGGMKNELGDWKVYGGHRMWYAPEAIPRTYSPDNDPVEFKLIPNGIELTQKTEPKTGIQKQMVVTLDPEGTSVSILHRVFNRNFWAVDLAPWGLSIMKGGGVTIIPHEPFIKHEDELLPARPLVLWHYTDLTDPRFIHGKKYLRLKTETTLSDPQKIGVLNKQGWMAYHRDKTLFVKRFPFRDGVTYPDFGSNAESYTAGDFMEVETLGWMHKLDTNQRAEHTERWFLFKNVDIGATEATLDAAISPLVAQTKL